MSIYTAAIVSIICAVFSCAYALWRGGGPERLAAALILSDWLTSPFLQSHDAFHHAQIAIFALDALLAAALVTIALRANRYWPLWAAAFQILEILIHVAMLVDHHVRPRAYFIGMEVTSYLILMALVVGVFFEAPKSPRLQDASII